jgi:hypothetical protein
MSTIITKFSDYILHSIEFFISSIETELSYRDLKGLTNNKIQLIKVIKEHPLAMLMAAHLSDNRNSDNLRSSIIPAISVTPGNSPEGGFTFGKSYEPGNVDSDFIDDLKGFLVKNDKEIQSDVLITKDQIESIISEYNRSSAGEMRYQKNQWHRNEEINISVWSDSADLDILLGNLMDSILTSIQVGFIGDDSPLKDFKYNITKGLVNFNFGRPLYGSEYNLTFLNSFNNYIIYKDDNVSGHTFTGTYRVIGDE